MNTRRAAAADKQQHAMHLADERSAIRKELAITRRLISDLQARLQRARNEEQLQQARLEHVERAAYDAEHAALVDTHALAIATAAAQLRARAGLPNIRPTRQALPYTPDIATARIPSRVARYPYSSIMRQALTEAAWKRRRLWQKHHINRTPAAVQAIAIWITETDTQQA